MATNPRNVRAKLIAKIANYDEDLAIEFLEYERYLLEKIIKADEAVLEAKEEVKEAKKVLREANDVIYILKIAGLL